MQYQAAHLATVALHTCLKPGTWCHTADVRSLSNPSLLPLRFFDEVNVQNGGNRYATVLTYLETTEEGGETVRAVLMCVRTCILPLPLPSASRHLPAPPTALASAQVCTASS